VPLDIFKRDNTNGASMIAPLTIGIGLRMLAAFCAAVLMASTANAAELVMFRRDGCVWCAKWDREIGPIYPKTEFNSRAPLRLVNLDHDPDPALVHGRILYTPTFVLAENGKEVGRIEGYPGDELFWVRLENMLAHVPQSATKELPEGVSIPGASSVVPERIR
jgi:hypothetical protein